MGVLPLPFREGSLADSYLLKRKIQRTSA